MTIKTPFPGLIISYSKLIFWLLSKDVDLTWGLLGGYRRNPLNLPLFCKQYKAFSKGTTAFFWEVGPSRPTNWVGFDQMITNLMYINNKAKIIWKMFWPASWMHEGWSHAHCLQGFRTRSVLVFYFSLGPVRIGATDTKVYWYQLYLHVVYP